MLEPFQNSGQQENCLAFVEMDPFFCCSNGKISRTSEMWMWNLNVVSTIWQHWFLESSTKLFVGFKKVSHQMMFIKLAPKPSAPLVPPAPGRRCPTSRFRAERISSKECLGGESGRAVPPTCKDIGPFKTKINKKKPDRNHWQRGSVVSLRLI